jgi:hypothetical protein
LERKRVLYGIAGIYSLTSKAKGIARLPMRNEKIRVEQIPHDIAVLEWRQLQAAKAAGAPQHGNGAQLCGDVQ